MHQKNLDIVQINGLDNKGGAAKASFALHQEYKKRGLKSTILVGQKTDDSLEDIYEIKGRYTNKYIERYARKLKLTEYLPISNPGLFSNPFYEHSDIVHLHNLHGGYFNLKNLVKMSGEKPVIWTLHDMWAYTANSPHTFGCNRWKLGEIGNCTCGQHNGQITRIAEKYFLDYKRNIYDKSDFTLVVPSKWMKDNVKESILKDKNLEVIYNGVDEEIFKPQDKERARRELKLPLDKKILCFVAHGGLKNEWKGGAYLLEAWEEIRKRNDTVLLEIGVKGDRIVEDNNHIRIPYMTSSSLMAKYYNASDIFIFTSLGESSSLVAMEALFCNVPVVSFDVGPLKEIVLDGCNGLITEYKDVNDFIQKVNTILDDDNLKDKLAGQARESVIEKYTFRQYVDNYLKLYDKVLNCEFDRSI